MSEQLIATFDITVSDDIRPGVDEVAALVRQRTRSDTGGRIIGVFDATTSPTAEQVDSYIEGALDTVRLDLADVLPVKLTNFVRHLVALRAAMSVELSYSHEQSNGTDDAYPRLKELYDAGMLTAGGYADETSSGDTRRAGSARMRSGLVADVLGVEDTLAIGSLTVGPIA